MNETSLFTQLATIVAWSRENYEAVVAGCALFLTAYQTHTKRKHNRLSVRPRLVVTSHLEPIETHLPALMYQVRVVLKNAGLGPAIINRYRVTLDENFQEFHDYSELDALLRKEFGSTYQGGTLFIPRTGFVMKAGEEQELASVKFAERLSDQSGELAERLEHIHALINYQCSYGKTFKYDTRDHLSNRPKRLGNITQLWRKPPQTK